MKKKSIVLQLRKSKIANFQSIYGGATNPCNSPSAGNDTASPTFPDPKSIVVDHCSGGRQDEPQNTDTQ